LRAKLNLLNSFNYLF